jgi:Fic family protein
MATEAQLETLGPQWTAQQVWSPQTVCDIHQDLFARLPDADRIQGTGKDNSVLVPGLMRQREVSVGRHAAPTAAVLPAFMQRWADVYGHVRRGEMQVLAMAAAHQRLAWIHPFVDGNGRVARLHSHLVLSHMGLTNGLWSPLRGFARSQDAYYAQLAAADEPRAGDLDGRGNLTEAGLLTWIHYVIETCIDQVGFMTQLLSLEGMKDRIAACGRRSHGTRRSRGRPGKKGGIDWPSVDDCSGGTGSGTGGWQSDGRSRWGRAPHRSGSC